MFGQMLLTQPRSAGFRALYPHLASFLAHVGVAVVLFTSQFGAKMTRPPESLRHVTLLFPLAEEIPVGDLGRVVVPPRPVPRVPEPKLFSPPLPPPRRELLPEAPPAPAPEVKPLPVSVAPADPVPPPPLATNNLGDVVAAAPVPSQKPVQQAGFSQLEKALASGPREVSLKTGTFGAAETARNQSPARGLALPKGDGFDRYDAGPAAASRAAAGPVGSFGSVSTAPARSAGQAQGAASAGFSQAVSAPRPVERAATTAPGGFGDASVVAPSRKPDVVPARVPPGATPVEILSKPRPAYSEEARRLKIEGEVTVELLFSATGEARVLRVIRGLGHGLDENAVAAAQAIRFRPAQRAGQPVDSTAIVHISFQLAF